tara:strand:- start:1599 stop:2312 length:714 start_codon:yes stop_codon:yes gene_type:complete
MSKLTRKPFNIQTLIFKAGDKLKDIPNLSDWLIEHRAEYTTGEIAEYLKKSGVHFKRVQYVSELSGYLPPKRSLFLSLEPYIERLRVLYLENYRKVKPKPDSLYYQPTSTLDMQVLTQWVQEIKPLRGLKYTSLRGLALYHLDRKLIQQARQDAFSTVQAEIEAGVEYNDLGLFSIMPTHQSTLSTHESKNSDAEALVVLLDVVEKQKEDIAKLKNRIEQIETLLDIKVQDLLRAVK